MFNKGVLMNSAFVEIGARGPFDCYIFHDVDMLPEDDRNIYACAKTPRHLGAYIKKYDYRYRTTATSRILDKIIWKNLQY